MSAAVLLLVLLLIGTPIAVAIALAATAFVSASPFPFTLIAQRIFEGINSFEILAIPLFVLAGELMNTSGITRRIVDFANAWVGHRRSGLAQVNIWSSVIFSGLSGSAVADTSALGRVFIPAMEKEGYPRAFAAALVAAASVMGPLIPPSIPMIIYALIAQQMSVPAMFLAGIVPGLLLAVALSVYVRFLTPEYAARHERANRAERWRALRAGILPLAMPIFVVGSIVGGIVTPTEAAAFAACYALVIGVFVFRSLKLRDVFDVFVRSMRDSSVILLIIAVVSLGNWLLTFAQIPQELSTFVLRNIHEAWLYLLLVNLLLLAVGLFLEGTAALLVLVPILQPIAVQMGIDPLHFSIVVIFNLMIGLTTPPMGLCLFVADSIANVGIAKLSRTILPMFATEVAVLFLITYVPGLVTWLPHVLGF